jgi:hypothetical protein
MRRRLWMQHKKNHLLTKNVKAVTESDTLRRIVGNYTLRSTPNIFRKGRRKHRYQWMLRNGWIAYQTQKGRLIAPISRKRWHYLVAVIRRRRKY